MGINIAQTGSLSKLTRKQIIWTMAGVMLAMFLSSLDQTVVGTAMPRIIADLGGFSKYTWVTTAYIITSAVTVPITGKLIDMYGRKVFFIIGLAIFISFSLGCGLSSTMTQIIFFRGAQGIGAGIIMANVFTVIADLFPPAERGKYQGFMSGLFGLSSVIGPTLGGFLTDTLSWHWVFFVNIPLGLFIIALSIKFFPNIRPDNLKHRVDYAGLSALILMVVPALLALSWGGIEYPWVSAEIIGMFIFSAIMLGLFLFLESRAKEPIIPLALFKNPIFSVSAIAIFLTGIGMFGGITFIPLFLQGVQGASAIKSGNFLIPMTGGIIVGSLTSGQILSRAGGHYRIQGVVGTALICVGLGLLSTINVNTSYSRLIAYMVVVGLGLGVTFPLYTIAVQNAVQYNMMGVATSATSFFRSIGGSVGLAILGSVMSNRYASELMSKIPDTVKSAIPPDKLASIANPQNLLNPQALADLQARTDPNLLNQIIAGIKQALASSIAGVFMISLIIVTLALVANFFLKEIPLRKQHIHEVVSTQKVETVSESPK